MTLGEIVPLTWAWLSMEFLDVTVLRLTNPVRKYAGNVFGPEWQLFFGLSCALKVVRCE